jgi:hypothetical protein
VITKRERSAIRDAEEVTEFTAVTDRFAGSGCKKAIHSVSEPVSETKQILEKPIM